VGFHGVSARFPDSRFGKDAHAEFTSMDRTDWRDLRTGAGFKRLAVLDARRDKFAREDRISAHHRSVRDGASRVAEELAAE
jgi:hypothetical protein